MAFLAALAEPQLPANIKYCLFHSDSNYYVKRQFIISHSKLITMPKNFSALVSCSVIALLTMLIFLKTIDEGKTWKIIASGLCFTFFLVITLWLVRWKKKTNDS